jgi:hypothetical protein
VRTKCRLHLAFATAVILLAAANSGQAAGAPACDDLIPSSTFRLIAAHPTETEEVTATREEMDEVASRIGTTAAAREAHPLMLTAAEGGAHVELDHRPIENRNAAGNSYYCDIPSFVTIIIGAVKQRVYLYQEAAAAPCVRNALLRHYRRHSELLNVTIDAFVNKHRNALEQ